MQIAGREIVMVVCFGYMVTPECLESICWTLGRNESSRPDSREEERGPLPPDGNPALTVAPSRRHAMDGRLGSSSEHPERRHAALHLMPP
jgi:hypothetical protein